MKLFTVDAFAAAPFTGNPAAPFTGNPAGVCILEEPRPDAWMLSVAAELGYSETAFMLRDGGSLGLRWFTPTVEVDICGHATLAAAHVLFEFGEKGSELVFATRSGELRARRDGDHVVIDLPARQLTQIPEPEGLREILGLSPSFVGQCEATWLAVLPDADAVRSLVVDLAAVAELPITSLIVTAEGEPGGGFDIVSRYFRPIDGIPEDPVTGSAHCLLDPYWKGAARKIRPRRLSGIASRWKPHRPGAGKSRRARRSRIHDPCGRAARLSGEQRNDAPRSAGIHSSWHTARSQAWQALVMATEQRYTISYGALGPVLTLLGLGRRFSSIERSGDQVHVKMGWGFRAKFPVASVRSVTPYAGVAMGIGVHGFGGNYLVNGKASGIVTVEIEPSARALVIGIPVKLRKLSVSLDEPEQFIADFRTQVG